MIYKLLLVLLLIVIIICTLNKNCKNNFNKIEYFKNQEIIDTQKYNEMHKIQDINNKIKKDIKGSIKDSVINLNKDLIKSQLDFKKDKEYQNKILKQCAIDIDPTRSFNKIPKKACVNRNFIGTTFSSIATCAKSCERNSDCLSFSHNNNTDECRLSASCYDLNMVKNDNFDTYIKKNAKIDDYPLTKYNFFIKKKCKFTDDMSSTISNISIIDCAKKCNTDSKCISYHFKNNKDNIGTCSLSSKCFMGGCTIDDNSYTLFTKYHFNQNQLKYRQCVGCPIIAKPILINVKSAGKNSKDSNRGVWINNKKVATAGRSYNLLVVELTGLKGIIAHKEIVPKIIFNKNYDVYNSKNGKNTAISMSNDMNKYNKNGYLLIIHTYDEPSNNHNYITSLWNGKYNNFNIFRNIKYRNAYGLIYQNGKGTLQESLSVNNINIIHNFKYEII